MPACHMKLPSGYAARSPAQLYSLVSGMKLAFVKALVILDQLIRQLAAFMRSVLNDGETYGRVAA
jgi:hypothetical protein